MVCLWSSYQISNTLFQWEVTTIRLKAKQRFHAAMFYILQKITLMKVPVTYFSTRLLLFPSQVCESAMLFSTIGNCWEWPLMVYHTKFHKKLVNWFKSWKMDSHITTWWSSKSTFFPQDRKLGKNESKRHLLIMQSLHKAHKVNP